VVRPLSLLSALARLITKTDLYWGVRRGGKPSEDSSESGKRSDTGWSRLSVFAKPVFSADTGAPENPSEEIHTDVPVVRIG
jgi:hypothetical protein